MEKIGKCTKCNKEEIKLKKNRKICEECFKEWQKEYNQKRKLLKKKSDVKPGRPKKYENDEDRKLARKNCNIKYQNKRYKNDEEYRLKKIAIVKKCITNKKLKVTTLDNKDLVLT